MYSSIIVGQNGTSPHCENAEDAEDSALSP